MRDEATRTTLQNTLDRATPASLTQALDPVGAVADHFTKAGMSQYLGGLSVTKGVTWPQVWGVMRLKYVAWQFCARALGTTSSTRTTQ